MRSNMLGRRALKDELTLTNFLSETRTIHKKKLRRLRAFTECKLKLRVATNEGIYIDVKIFSSQI